MPSAMARRAWPRSTRTARFCASATSARNPCARRTSSGSGRFRPGTAGATPTAPKADFLTVDEIENLTIPAGTLTRAERRIINHHIDVTIRMLEALPWPQHLKNVPEYAGGHHERMDGKGYPRGLTRAQMSVQARCMGIADIFEALTAADRPYKKGKTLSESLRDPGPVQAERAHRSRPVRRVHVGEGVSRVRGAMHGSGPDRRGRRRGDPGLCRPAGRIGPRRPRGPGQRVSRSCRAASTRRKRNLRYHSARLRRAGEPARRSTLEQRLAMTSLTCADILAGRAPTDSPVTLRGWVRTRRDSKAGISFVHVSDGSCFHPVQVVAPNSLPNYADEVLHLTAGCAVEATGAHRAVAGERAALRDAGRCDQGRRLGRGSGHLPDPAEAAHARVPARSRPSAAADQRHRRGHARAPHDRPRDPPASSTSTASSG